MTRVLPLILVLVFSCKEKVSKTSSYLAFMGTVIIDGNGKTTIKNGTLLVKDGRVMAMGNHNDIDIPKNTQIQDISGKTTMV